MKGQHGRFQNNKARAEIQRADQWDNDTGMWRRRASYGVKSLVNKDLNTLNIGLNQTWPTWDDSWFFSSTVFAHLTNFAFKKKEEKQ